MAARPARRFATGPRRARGFTLIELLVVAALIAIASAVTSLALRDPNLTRLDRESERLAVLLESARAEARASAVAATWEPGGKDGQSFHFNGLPTKLGLPTHWLDPEVTAEIVGATKVVLGPEPLIGAQRIVLRLDEYSRAIHTDGLAPFTVDPRAPGAQEP